MESGMRIGKNDWYPLENGHIDTKSLTKKARKQLHRLVAAPADVSAVHYSQFPDTAHVGLGGPMIAYSKLRKLPKVYHLGCTSYDGEQLLRDC